jgi:hypothetical protein
MIEAVRRYLELESDRKMNYETFGDQLKWEQQFGTTATK